MSVSTQEAVGRVLAKFSQHGLADNDLGRRELRCVAPPVEGGSIAGALVLAHGGGNVGSTVLLAPESLRLEGGRLQIHSGGKNNVVVLDGGASSRTPHIVLNLFADEAVVYLNLDEMRPVPRRPLGLQVTFYNGPGQFFHWGAGSSSVQTVAVLDGPGRSVVIGEDCMLSNDVYLRTHDGHAIVDLNSREILNPGGCVRLRNRVWLAQDVLCLGPLDIGAGSIVGAKSLAKGDVGPSTLVGGVPARVLRDNVGWSRVPGTLQFLDLERARES